MNIELRSGLVFSTIFASDGQGVPVLLIDGLAYGPGDHWTIPLLVHLDRAAGLDASSLQEERQELAVHRLGQLCIQHSGIDGVASLALKLFCIASAARLRQSGNV